MIPFEDVDSKLEELDKDRAWLAKVIRRSPETLDSALAPKAAEHKRSRSLQGLITDAIEREEARQKSEKAGKAKLPPGYSEIFLTDEELNLADQASRIVNAPSLATFCHDVIQTQARLIIAENEKKNGTNDLK